MDELKKSIDKLNKTIIHVAFILITFLVEMYLIDLTGRSRITYVSLCVVFIWVMNIALLHILKIRNNKE